DLRRLQPDDVVAAIHVQDLARHTGAQVAAQEHRGPGDVLLRDVAAQRRLLRHEAEDVLEAAHRRGGERLHGARADGVDADALRPEVRGEVAYARLEGGLGYPHHVVAGHDLLRAVVRQR